MEHSRARESDFARKEDKYHSRRWEDIDDVKLVRWNSLERWSSFQNVEDKGS